MTILLSNWAYARSRGKLVGETMHILVADDDPELRNVVEALLIDHGYRVSIAQNSAEARSFIDISDIDLILLDLKLPDESGLELTRYLREHYNVAIIILTGMGETIDRIVGLELGADDYVSKPFDLRELVARIRSVLRRTQTVPEQQQPKIAYFTGWQLNFTTRQLTSPQGKDVLLTGAEFALLSTFVEHSNRPLSREQILRSAYHREAEPGERTIDVQVGHLRRKIEGNPKRPQFIKTIHGTGYIFAASVEYDCSAQPAERIDETDTIE